VEEIVHINVMRLLNLFHIYVAMMQILKAQDCRHGFLILLNSFEKENYFSP